MTLQRLIFAEIKLKPSGLSHRLHFASLTVFGQITEVVDGTLFFTIQQLAHLWARISLEPAVRARQEVGICWNPRWNWRIFRGPFHPKPLGDPVSSIQGKSQQQQQFLSHPFPLEGTDLGARMLLLSQEPGGVIPII